MKIFNKLLKKQKKSVETLYTKNGENLYVFFGGIANGIAMPPFEFFNASRIINENKLFLRDFNQMWYHNGLLDISTDINTTANFIKSEINKLNPKKIIFIGNSMGGYGAIMFANLIENIDEVIAFAPQTFISKNLRSTHNDKRWEKQIFQLYENSQNKNKYFDLKEMLISINSKVKISIFVSKDDILDRLHALHLKEIPGVSIYEFDDGGHGIVKKLKDDGKLKEILAGEYIHILN